MKNPPRIVEINSKKYCEGMLEAVIRELDDEPEGSEEQRNEQQNGITFH
jgi:hypothetical protein